MRCVKISLSACALLVLLTVGTACEEDETVPTDPIIPSAEYPKRFAGEVQLTVETNTEVNTIFRDTLLVESVGSHLVRVKPDTLDHFEARISGQQANHYFRNPINGSGFFAGATDITGSYTRGDSTLAIEVVGITSDTGQFVYLFTGKTIAL